MNRLEEALARVVDNPEDDAARLAYADAVEPQDPRRADWIRWHIAYEQMRIGDGLPSWAQQHRKYRSTPGFLDDAKLMMEWAKPIVPYCRDAASWEYHRGFIIHITTSPYTLLEHGEKIFSLAPIRFIELTVTGNPATYDNTVSREIGRFPMKELMASPLLKRLDGIIFWGAFLSLDDIRLIAESPNLDRLVYLKFYNLWAPVLEGAWEIFASSPTTRKLLAIEGDVESYPGEWECWDDNDPYLEGGVPQPVRPHGRELEAKYGYLPWLHPYHNRADRYDMARLVARGKLPRYPVGTPVTEEMYEVPKPVRNDHYW